MRLCSSLFPYTTLFRSGFVVLVHDHRNFGESDGVPRQDIDPWAQVADWRRAISYLESHSLVDPQRIGIWGTSFSGGHALVLAARSEEHTSELQSRENLV